MFGGSGSAQLHLLRHSLSEQVAVTAYPAETAAEVLALY